jgi:putative CocE/NonD family hydrolase
MVPMRDKVQLATDIYLPIIKGKIPLVFIRTPYGKNMLELEGKYWARRGYACAIQDCRGRFDSEGELTPFLNEAEDGYDSIEWLAVRPWCNGKVGMIGGSYVGWVQWWAASQNPPHLVTIIPNVSPPDPHYNIPYEYGTFFIFGSIWWARILESEATADLGGATMHKINDADYSKILKTLPVIDLDEHFLGKENKYWREWIKNADNKKYWDKANFLDKLKNVSIPVFHQSGWFDGDGIGTKLNYLKMKSHDHKYQKLILGPWGHTDTATRMIGERDFGPEAAINLQREYIRWFDFWLKGIQNGINKEPMVKMFTMNSNKWHTGNSYPLEKTKMQKLYITSNGNANTEDGDGILKWVVDTSQSPYDSYTYDPADPTPAPTFYPTKSSEEKAKIVYSQEEEIKKRKEYYRKTVNERKDILTYRTEPLKEPLTICGPISAVLYASSSAKDTDWYITLSEETESGEIFSLAVGKIRAKYRNSVFDPDLLEPGKVYKYNLDLWHTGITFQTGSRIRVEVASAIFPVFSRNLNTGGHSETETDFVKAEQKIYHNKEYPSHMLLPIIPEMKNSAK